MCTELNSEQMAKPQCSEQAFLFFQALKGFILWVSRHEVQNAPSNGVQSNF